MPDQPVPSPRKWYQKKRYLIPSGLLAFVIILGVIGAHSSPAPADTVPAMQQGSVAAPQVDGATTGQAAQPTAAPQFKVAGMVQAAATPAPTEPPSYYTNISGNQVQSPTYSNTVPSGASAQCRDGTYSFSQHRSGTCSHHGGVANWLN